MSGLVIAYRDYVQDATITHTSPSPGDFLPNMPASNAQTRQLEVKAGFLTSFVSGVMGPVNIAFAEPVTIGIVAILAHDFQGIASVRVQLSGSNGSYDETLNPWVPPADSQFPRHLIVVLDKNYEDVSQVIITVTTTGGSQTYTFGRIWAGPVWSPATGTGRREFWPRTVDHGVKDRSDGMQAYADAKPRTRVLTCVLPHLTEAEAFGTEDGTAQNLQDIGFEVGSTDPVIVIPTQRSNQLVHRMGCYGTFTEPPSPKLIEDSSGTEETGLAYTAQFDVEEEL